MTLFKENDMKICELLKKVSYQVICGSDQAEVTGISKDNRKAAAGDLFLCISGTRFDTHEESIIAALAEKGVKVFVTEKEISLPEGADCTVIRVKNTREAGAYLYSAWYQDPAEKMTMIAITGSKGKTTTTHMLGSILEKAGLKVGTIGTNGAIFNGEVHELANTTPDFDEAQKYLREMADSGVQACVFEVSSQGMKYHRVDGIEFDYGIFMNIQTGDHIGPNEHESFEDYIYWKAQVVNHSRLAFIHSDDEFHEDFMKLVTCPHEFFGSGEEADYRAFDIEKTFDEEEDQPGISFKTAGKVEDSFWLNLPGDFNVWNALAAIAVADHMQVPVSAMKEALSSMHIKGRDDIVYKGKFSVCVDFAHNGASAWHHLQALREYRPKRLVCVFGADGNRSVGRRHGMGEAAGKLADFSIVTSGHNRWETFEAILEDIKVGLHRAEHPDYIAIKDRKEAIRYAIENAQDGDLITILGLGHETWQEEMGVKSPHSDTEYVKEVLRDIGLLS